MKILITLIGVFFYTFSCNYRCQNIEAFNNHQNKITKIGMSTLGAWSIGNITSGAIGLSSPNKTTANFSQMNVMWGAVNLCLALPGYLKARKNQNAKYSFSKTYKEQTKIEKIFLFNTALDVAYVTGGALMIERAKWDLENTEMWNGYGKSMLIQGGFLFVFDLAMAVIHSQHRKKALDSKLNAAFE